MFLPGQCLSAKIGSFPQISWIWQVPLAVLLQCWQCQWMWEHRPLQPWVPCAGCCHRARSRILQQTLRPGVRSPPRLPPTSLRGTPGLHRGPEHGHSPDQAWYTGPPSSLHPLQHRTVSGTVERGSVRSIPPSTTPPSSPTQRIQHPGRPSRVPPWKCRGLEPIPIVLLLVLVNKRRDEMLSKVRTMRSGSSCPDPKDGARHPVPASTRWTLEQWVNVMRKRH